MAGGRDYHGAVAGREYAARMWVDNEARDVEPFAGAGSVWGRISLRISECDGDKRGRHLWSTIANGEWQAANEHMVKRAVVIVCKRCGRSEDGEQIVAIERVKASPSVVARMNRL